MLDAVPVRAAAHGRSPSPVAGGSELLHGQRSRHSEVPNLYLLSQMQRLFVSSHQCWCLRCNLKFLPKRVSPHCGSCAKQSPRNLCCSSPAQKWHGSTALMEGFLYLSRSCKRLTSLLRLWRKSEICNESVCFAKVHQKGKILL